MTPPSSSLSGLPPPSPARSSPPHVTWAPAPLSRPPSSGSASPLPASRWTAPIWARGLDRPTLIWSRWRSPFWAPTTSSWRRTVEKSVRRRRRRRWQRGRPQTGGRRRLISTLRTRRAPVGTRRPEGRGGSSSKGRGGSPCTSLRLVIPARLQLGLYRSSGREFLRT